MKYKYGISLEDYDRMLASQNGHCAACPKTPEDISRGMLFVDHNHETGEVRGLLCPGCNQALGFTYDSVDTLLNLATYLMSSQNVLECTCE